MCYTLLCTRHFTAEAACRSSILLLYFGFHARDVPPDSPDSAIRHHPSSKAQPCGSSLVCTHARSHIHQLLLLAQLPQYVCAHKSHKQPNAMSVSQIILTNEWSI